MEPLVRDPDPDPEAIVDDPESLPLEASAADVVDQRRDVPLADEEEDHL